MRALIPSMEIRSRSEVDLDTVDRPSRLGAPARDILAAVLLTFAAIVFIAVASTDGPQQSPEQRRQEAAAGGR